MLILGIITLVMTLPLASLFLSTILIHGFAFLIFLPGALLSEMRVISTNFIFTKPIKFNR
jgi:hypothetical protein